MNRYLLAAVSTFLFQLSPAVAHDSPEIARHPAAHVVFQYLRNTTGHQWTKAAALIDKESLEGIRQTYLAGQGGDAVAHGELFGDLDPKGLAALELAEFYARYKKGTEEMLGDPADLDRILATLAVKLITLGEEHDGARKLCHIIVRTRIEPDGQKVSALRTISLVEGKDSGWKVVLDFNDPGVRAAGKAAE